MLHSSSTACALLCAQPFGACLPACSRPCPHSHSLQNFFRGYPKLAGMTGTAATEGAEFQEIYNLRVTVVPPNRAISREDNPDVVFRWAGWSGKKRVQYFWAGRL